ncbi:MAG: hypothetical protein L6V35_08075 [Alistipes putredinis]|nr:MAG: hypothetical protein L6V35_08075 [Alistipes putredinis]
MAAAVSVSAQSWKEDPRYGNTPEEREENVKILNFFNDAWDAKNYDDANKYLAHLLEKAPKATQNLLRARCHALQEQDKQSQD